MNQNDDLISKRVALDAMKDMYRAAEKWLRDATDDVTKARAESCMASLVEIKLRIEKLPVVQPATSCSEIPNSSDSISRQAAIDAIDDIESEVADGFGFQYEKWRKYFCELPAIHPDHNADVSKKVEKEDCVSRRVAIDALDIAIERYDEMAEEYRKKADIERNDYMDMRDDAYEARQLAQWLNELKHLRGKIEQLIMRLPSAKQEIIDCFECTHYKPISNSWGKCYVHSSSTERFRTCQSCDYCSWAERRQDD